MNTPGYLIFCENISQLLDGENEHLDESEEDEQAKVKNSKNSEFDRESSNQYEKNKVERNSDQRYVKKQCVSRNVVYNTPVNYKKPVVIDQDKLKNGNIFNDNSEKRKMKAVKGRTNEEILDIVRGFL
ncbi:hypothetical protein EDEG_01855 [Edhazardia aedis USNM 41457]|uniref:Uncharacterized protein n=1 Tax=Edhazardia aedis (strain USNM 41457) TaxID=1003232 RepID=J9D7T0_EDHAE|nr:hypothetical protein EDEG_01855 [Edhazardia aedis USNM 41457]|eukprot:EJW03856.1 hypothetical protein EDEG_01855 [Edhazardia aedis USNM 41457]